VGAAIWAAALLAVTEFVRAQGSSTDVRVLITFLIYLVAAVGLQTFAGNSGHMSFGHVGLMAVGAYTAAVLTTAPLIKRFAIPNAPRAVIDVHLGFVPATLIAMAATALVALVVGIPLVRLSGAALAVASIGLLIIIFTAISEDQSLTRGSQTFYGIPLHTTPRIAWLCAAGVIVVARLFRDSSSGLCLRSSQDDDLASRAAGVDVARARLHAWVLSGAIVALAGSLYAHYILALTPRTFYFNLTMIIVSMVIVGGSSITGAVIGATVVTLLTEFLRRAEDGASLGPVHFSQAPGLSEIGLGVLILLTMMLRPSGLVGRWELDDLATRRRQRRPARRETDRPIGREPNQDGGPA
jgi:branched-chain amino acid transport system permease protein